MLASSHKHYVDFMLNTLLKVKRLPSALDIALAPKSYNVHYNHRSENSTKTGNETNMIPEIQWYKVFVI